MSNEQELSFDEVLMLAGKVENWYKVSESYAGAINDLTVLLSFPMEIDGEKVVRVGITYDKVSLADYTSPRMFEFYNQITNFQELNSCNQTEIKDFNQIKKEGIILSKKILKK